MEFITKKVLFIISFIYRLLRVPFSSLAIFKFSYLDLKSMLLLNLITVLLFFIIGINYIIKGFFNNNKFNKNNIDIENIINSISRYDNLNKIRILISKLIKNTIISILTL